MSLFCHLKAKKILLHTQRGKGTRAVCVERRDPWERLLATPGNFSANVPCHVVGCALLHCCRKRKSQLPAGQTARCRVSPSLFLSTGSVRQRCLGKSCRLFCPDTGTLRAIRTAAAGGWGLGGPNPVIHASHAVLSVVRPPLSWLRSPHCEGETGRRLSNCSCLKGGV